MESNTSLLFAVLFGLVAMIGQNYEEMDIHLKLDPSFQEVLELFHCTNMSAILELATRPVHKTVKTSELVLPATTMKSPEQEQPVASSLLGQVSFLGSSFSDHSILS